MDGADELMHATAVALGRRVALIRGPAGAGKSDLALRCLGLSPSQIIAETLRLVADDYVMLSRRGERLVARPPASIAGKLEVRGLGVIPVAHAAEGDVRLVVELCRREEIERYPDPVPRVTLLGLSFPVLRLAPFEASAALKLAAALATSE